MSNSSLYGNLAGATTVPSNDTTSLYGASVNAQVPNSNGDLLIKGNLAVDGGNITTTATIATLFNTNATTLGIGGAATSLSLGASTGSTSINNNLIVGGTINAGGDITAPGGKFGNITIGVATDNTITTTTGNLNLQSSTGILQVSPATYIEWAENSLRTNRLNFKSTNGTSTGIRVQPPVATGGIATASVNTTNDINNTQFVNISTSQASTNPLRIATGAYTGGVLGGSGTSLAFIDGSANTYATVNPSGPTIGTDLTTKTYVDTAIAPFTTYSINASSITGGANINLAGANSSVSTVELVSGTGITVAQTDNQHIRITNAGVTSAVAGTGISVNSSTGAVTITNSGVTSAVAGSGISVSSGTGAVTFTNTGVRSITGTANQVIASASTGAVTLSLPQDINTSSTPAFAAVNTSTINSASTFGFSNGSSNYATVNPSGPTNNTDLITKTYFDTHTGGAPNHLQNGSYAVTLNSDGTVTFPSFTLSTGTGLAPGGGNGQSLLLDQITPGNYVAEWNYATTLSNGTAIPTTRYDLTINTDGTVSFPNYKFPVAAGTNGQVLQTNGSGVLSWYTPTAGTITSVTGTNHISATTTSGAVTVTSDATTTATASTLVARDSNANISTNCLFEGYTNQAAGTLIVLTAASVQNWAITGSGGQTIQLPNATTLPAGATFTFNNNQSSGTIVITNNSTTTIATVQSGAYIIVVLLDNSTAAGSWDYHNAPPSNASWSTNTLNWAGSYTNGTWNGNTIAVNRGGTGLGTTPTNGQLLIGNGTNYTLAGLTAGTHMVVTNGSGSISLSTDATNANTASTIVARDASGNFSAGTITANTSNGNYVLGQEYFTRNSSWTPPANSLTSLDGNNGIAIGSSSGTNGYSPQIQLVYNSGDTTAGTNASAAIVTRGSAGTNASPTAIATNQVAGTWNIDGYATSGWASAIATTGSGAGTSSINPLQVQAYAVSAFTDSAGTVTNAPMGFRVRGFAASTNLSTANRTNFIDHQYATATYKASTFNIQAASSTTNYAQFASGGHTIGEVDAVVLLNRLTAGTPSSPNQKNALTIESRRSDQSGVTDTDNTGFAYRVGGTGNFYWTNQIKSQYSSTGNHQYLVQAAAGDQTSSSPSFLNLMSNQPTQTIIYAGTAGSGGSTSAKLTIDASKVTAAVPVAFPVYTASAANAITGSVGWQIAISNSPTVGGRMAFWDTTNSRWSYVSDNTAV